MVLFSRWILVVLLIATMIPSKSLSTKSSKKKNKKEDEIDIKGEGEVDLSFADMQNPEIHLPKGSKRHDPLVKPAYVPATFRPMSEKDALVQYTKYAMVARTIGRVIGSRRSRKNAKHVWQYFTQRAQQLLLCYRPIPPDLRIHCLTQGLRNLWMRLIDTKWRQNVVFQQVILSKFYKKAPRMGFLGLVAEMHGYFMMRMRLLALAREEARQKREKQSKIRQFFSRVYGRIKSFFRRERDFDEPLLLVLENPEYYISIK